MKLTVFELPSALILSRYVPRSTAFGAKSCVMLERSRG